MRALRSLLAGAALLIGASVAVPTIAAEETPHAPSQKWSFAGPFGTFDLASAQRGFQIYSEVCSACHSMSLLSYRDLTGIGLSPEQVKAIAAGFDVPLGTNDAGDPITGPATPASKFRSPFPNEKAARAGNNGALPPDLSVIANARENGPNYLYALLTGYEDAPKAVQMQAGMNYNKYFPGHQIAMPAPLSADRVTYADGTPASLDQEAHDVVTFLAWAANPEMVERKQIGVRIVLFLIFMTGITYAVKRQVWADVH